MILLNPSAITILLVLNISFTHKANAQENLKNIRIEYIGDTDKAPPIVIIGLEKPKKILPWESFYKGTLSMLTSIKKDCLKDWWVESIPTKSILRATFLISEKNNVRYFNDKANINSFLNCIINLTGKEADFHWLRINLKDIQNTVSYYD